MDHRNKNALNDSNNETVAFSFSADMTDIIKIETEKQWRTSEKLQTTNATSCTYVFNKRSTIERLSI